MRAGCPALDVTPARIAPPGTSASDPARRPRRASAVRGSSRLNKDATRGTRAQHARHGPPWTYMDMDSQVTAANEVRTNVRIHPTPRTRQEWTDLARVHDMTSARTRATSVQIDIAERIAKTSANARA